MTNPKNKKELSKEEKKVIEQCGTEPPFSSDLLEENRPGTFKCKKCGQELFKTKHKYKSGTGWPSFYDIKQKNAIKTKKDTSQEKTRTEVICSNCKAHLGHLFNDGPPDKTGKRYCINGIALEFETEK